MTTAVPHPPSPDQPARPDRVGSACPSDAELAALLEHGPFPDALRAAIAASGLSLDRIQYRLGRRGVRISVATLSYWQSGRRRPERPTSIAALGQLEEVLGLGPSALSALLGPPRPRGRRGGEGLPAMESFWGQKNGALELLSGVYTDTDRDLRRLSQYDRARIGANHRMQSLFCRQVMRAETNGVDRWMLVSDWGEATRPARPIITHVRNCAVGAVHTSEDSSVFCVELLFERPLRRGETLLFEYELANPRAAAPATEPSDRVCRKFRVPCREYLLELLFDPSALPARVQQYSLDPDGPHPRTRNLAISASGSAHTIAMDLGAGEFGIRWDW